MPFRFKGHNRQVRFRDGVWQVWSKIKRKWVKATGVLLIALTAMQPVPACFVEPLEVAMGESHTHNESHPATPAFMGQSITMNATMQQTFTTYEMGSYRIG
jgi:hypothetical protein